MNAEENLIREKVDELVSNQGVMAANRWVQALGESNVRRRLMEQLAEEYEVRCLDCENKQYYHENEETWFCPGCGE